jgi:hypothetical protein
MFTFFIQYYFSAHFDLLNKKIMTGDELTCSIYISWVHCSLMVSPQALHMVNAHIAVRQMGNGCDCGPGCLKSISQSNLKRLKQLNNNMVVVIEQMSGVVVHH